MNSQYVKPEKINCHWLACYPPFQKHILPFYIELWIIFSLNSNKIYLGGIKSHITVHKMYYQMHFLLNSISLVSKHMHSFK